MSEIPEPSQQAQTDDLQFTTVEPAAGAGQDPAPGPVCVACHRPIASTYYAVGDKLVCPDCRDRYAAAFAGGSRFGRLARATILGIIGGVIGALIWFAVRRVTGYEVGLIAVVVGLLVGGAVRMGSNGRGGRGYQTLAVVLTYVAIAANYMPDIFEAMYRQYQQNHATTAGKTKPDNELPGGAPSNNSSQAPNSAVGQNSKRISPIVAVLLLILLVLIVFAFALAAPILAGIHNLIGLFIIGFALWEAWKINTRRRVTFAGPYSLSAGNLGPPAASGGQP